MSTFISLFAALVFLILKYAAIFFIAMVVFRTLASLLMG